jgi:hypothetical protein
LSLMFNTLGPMIVLALVIALLGLPLLLRLDRVLLWSWLFLFPLVYYDPLRIASIILGERSNLAVPIFLFVALPGALISLATRWDVHRRLLPVTLPVWFLVAGFLSDVPRYKSLYSLDYFVRDFVGVVVTLYLLSICWRFLQENAGHSGRILKGLLLVGLLNAVAIIAEHYLRFGLVDAGGFNRPMGLFGFPILASFITVLSLILALYGYFTAAARFERFGYLGCALILLMACLMSLTKTNIFQMLLIFGMWGMFLPKPLKLKALWSVLGLLVCFALWEVLIDQGGLWAQLVSRFSRTDTLSIRQSAWSIVAENLDLETVIWGKGWLSATALLGTYNYQYALWPIDLAVKGGISAIHPHNAYLKYLYEMGLFGVGMLLAYVGLMVRGYWQALRVQDTRRRMAGLALASLVTALLFSSLTGSPMAENYTLLFLSVCILVLAHEAGWFESHTRPQQQFPDWEEYYYSSRPQNSQG